MSASATQSSGSPLTESSGESAAAIGEALRYLLADVFTLYLKTKNFHWHMSGPYFRDYHLLLDEHGDQLFAMTDPIAERGRKLGTLTLHSIGEVGRLQRIRDDDSSRVDAPTMLSLLCVDERHLASSMRAVHTLCDQSGDVATASLLENWIDESERRSWFLDEITSRS
ncbi:Dps family protein [Acidicapsa ligni]|uniref:Dps family protein n=1 Tax=Acidicapsa ligni TaxID=542300 RepID=UPI0021E0B4F2|nr:DNA starvation/stationary phase protection protein [Acidicapsa ligni]